MSYMHKKTFDIINSVQEINNPNDYFPVDELIALPIQALNRKGYITASCCAGHPYENLIHYSEERFPNLEEVFIKDLENTVITKNTHKTYIVFEIGIFLPVMELPPGFFVNNDRFTDGRLYIEKTYNNSDVFVFLRDVLESIEQLHKWALNLPDFKY